MGDRDLAGPLGEEDPTRSHGALPSSRPCGHPWDPTVTPAGVWGGVHHSEPQFPHIKWGYTAANTTSQEGCEAFMSRAVER